MTGNGYPAAGQESNLGHNSGYPARFTTEEKIYSTFKPDLLEESKGDNTFLRMPFSYYFMHDCPELKLKLKSTLSLYLPLPKFRIKNKNQCPFCSLFH